jgi:hypothetical protein
MALSPTQNRVNSRVARASTTSNTIPIAIQSHQTIRLQYVPALRYGYDPDTELFRVRLTLDETLEQAKIPGRYRVAIHACYYWLLVAEGHLTRRLFAGMLRKIAALPSPERRRPC